MNPRRVTRHLRLVVYVTCALAVLYLWGRFDLYRLPEVGCSPLLRFTPGDTLLLDRRPRNLFVDDAVLVRGDDGLLYLAKVTDLADDRAWVETDAPDCPGRDSDQFGWVAAEDTSARVLMVWPW